MMNNTQSSPTIEKYSQMAKQSSMIAPELYSKYEVKRGLRDVSGKGVLAGLTEISEVRSYIIQDNDLIPCEGKLYYRGYDIEEIVRGFLTENRFGFEEVCYLLLFGELPSEAQYDEFRSILSDYTELPEEFVRDTIMSAPSRDMMNALAKGVLTLYSYDDNADNTSIENVVRQSLQLIAQFPQLAVYSYRSYSHYYKKKSLVIRPPKKGLSTAENILRMLRKDGVYSALEAKILDLALVLHLSLIHI